MDYSDILNFWFSEIEPAQWFKKEAAFDQLIAERFGLLHQQATQCELYSWRTTAQGRLAEIIVLDQFSRNMYRDAPAAFAADRLALALAQTAVATGDDLQLSNHERTFMYMPYMHSESKIVHVEALRLFKANGLQDNLDFEIRHKEIIDRFGRYPHRNEILGRKSSAAEIDFLQQPGSGF